MADDNKDLLQQEIDNLKIGFEQIRSSHQTQLSRLKDADEKLNMVLVFNGAVLALLISVIPFSKDNHILYIASIVLFSLFISSILLTCISIFLGLFPRGVASIDDSNHVNADTYNCETKYYLGKFMAAENRVIASISKLCEHKHAMCKHAMVLTIVNILLMVALIVIKII